MLSTDLCLLHPIYVLKFFPPLWQHLRQHLSEGKWGQRSRACISNFVTAMNKYLTRSNSRKEEFVWTLGMNSSESSLKLWLQGRVAVWSHQAFHHEIETLAVTSNLDRSLIQQGYGFIRRERSVYIIFEHRKKTAVYELEREPLLEPPRLAPWYSASQPWNYESYVSVA